MIHLIAAICAAGASLPDLTEALVWLDENDAAIKAGAPCHQGRREDWRACCARAKPCARAAQPARPKAKDNVRENTGSACALERTEALKVVSGSGRKEPAVRGPSPA
jgi:hypothetical protein